MKLLLISDTQFGAKNDYVPFIENNKLFFDNILFPYIDKNNIKVIIHLGDLFERRKFTNHYTAYRMLTDFINPLLDRNCYFHLILGNHDIFHRESLDITSAELFLPKNCYIYKKATEIIFDGTNILLIPWITKENIDHSLMRVANSNSPICFGHFELMGFETMKGNVKKEGMDPQLLSKFEMVLTGHYHHRSIKNNIYYVGSHAEFTWADYGDEHGFHIFDTTTKELEFVKNPYKVYAKIWYDDAYGVVSPPKDGFETLVGKIVKVIVSCKKDQAKYEWFMTEVENAQPLDIQIVDDHLNKDLIDDKSIASETETDTLDIIRSHIKQANNVVSADKVDSLVVDLYKAAQEME